MKKNIFALAVLSVFGMSAAYAVHVGSYDVNSYCGLFDGNNNDSPILVGELKNVILQSGDKVSMLKCTGNVTPPTTGRAVQYDYASTGIYCVIPNVLGAQITNKWHQTVSATGEATLTCLTQK